MSAPDELHTPPIKANQMDRGQQVELVAMQLFVGFLAALGGILLFVIAESLLGQYISSHYELFNEVLYAICSAYGGMLIGVAAVGFCYLKLAGFQQYFLRFSMQSVVGIIALPLMICAPLAMFHLNVSNILVNVMAAFLPLVGAVLGFNFLLVYTLKKKNIYPESLLATQ